METTVCPFCNSEKTSSLKAYCSIVSNENTRRFLNGIRPTFKYGIPVCIAGIAMMIAAYVIGNSSAYYNTFHEDNAFWKSYETGSGISFTGVLGIVMIAGIGLTAIIWGYQKYSEDTTARTSREQDKRFYESATACKDCNKAWVPGFEDKYRTF